MTVHFLTGAIYLLACLTAFAVDSLDTSIESCSHPLGMQDYGIDDSQISASSETVIDTERYGKHSGRMHGNFSWRARENSTTDEYLQVDLGQTKVVTAIATQGDNNATAWVTKFKVKSSNDGKTWKDYQSFQGNIDKHNRLTQLFYKPLTTRYVRVVPENWFGRISMKIELYGCYPTCDNQPVGLENGFITDSQVTASSTMSSGTKASNGRLGFTGDDSWCASSSDNYPYLLINMSLPHVLCAVATQGNSKADQMVTLYTIQTSLNGKNWTEYMEKGEVKIFHGNSDRDSISKHYFNNSPVGRYVRILPKAFIDAPCLRVEFYGVERASCDKAASGLAEPFYTISDSRFSTSSSLSSSYSAWHGRLLEEHAWEPYSNSVINYLQVDLGDPHIVCGVGIQPSGQWFRIDERTVSYNMSFSMDGKTWEFYPKVLPGNLNPVAYYPTIHISKNAFSEVQVAKFVRIYPVEYYQHKAIRMELYGLKQVWNKELGLEMFKGRSEVSEVQLSAPSSLEDHGPANARIYSGSSWCAEDANSSYLQIDFGSTKQLTGIAIQGDDDESYWLTEFNLEYGYLTNHMNTIKNISTQLDNRDELKVHWLANPVGARYVRIIPTKWFGKPCMRLDLHVNDRPPPAKITYFDLVGNLTAQNDSFVTVKCNASGDNSVNIKWLFGGRDVTDKSRGKATVNEETTSQLQVNFTSISDVMSNYNCEDTKNFTFKCQTNVTCLAMRADANGDRKDHVIEMFIIPPVKIVHSVLDGYLKALPGSNTTAKCIASGGSTVTIKWLLSGHDVTDKSRGQMYANFQTSSQLQVNFTDIAHVMSNYTCEDVENSQLKCKTNVTCQAVRADANVDRTDQLIEILIVPPAVRANIVNSVVVGDLKPTSGSFTTVKCTASGGSGVNIKWLLSGYDVTDKSRDQSYANLHTTSQLQVNFTSISDVMSNYNCEEVNDFRLKCKTNITCQAVRAGANEDRKDHVIEILIVLPVKIVSSVIDGYLIPLSGSFTTVKCIASGGSAVSIKWLLSGHDVTDKSRGQIYANWQTASQLQVNFTGIADVMSNYACEEVENYLLRCKREVTCHAVRGDSSEDKKDHVIEIFIVAMTSIITVKSSQSALTANLMIIVLIVMMESLIRYSVIY